jgi:hypothetical protein
MYSIYQLIKYQVNQSFETNNIIYGIFGFGVRASKTISNFYMKFNCKPRNSTFFYCSSVFSFADCINFVTFLQPAATS